MPEGSLLISVLRSGKGFVPTADTVLEEGELRVTAVFDCTVSVNSRPLSTPFACFSATSPRPTPRRTTGISP